MEYEMKKTTLLILLLSNFGIVNAQTYLDRQYQYQTGSDFTYNRYPNSYGNSNNEDVARALREQTEQLRRQYDEQRRMNIDNCERQKRMYNQSIIEQRRRNENEVGSLINAYRYQADNSQCE